MTTILSRSHSTAPESTTFAVYPQRWFLKAALCLFTCLTLNAVNQRICQAGGGPENVFLLVNSNSLDSLAIANHYIALRDIPASNVYYLPYQASKVIVTGQAFRDIILLPALKEIQKRKLTNQIDYFVYSSDFPWKVILGPDFPDEKFPPQLSPTGSLTGLTYLQTFVREKRKEVVNLNTNWYAIKPLHGVTVSRGFRSRYRWAPGGRRTASQGIPYVISAMLGVTDGRANTVDQVVQSLRRAKEADGTNPKGTVYFMKNKGARSKPRHDLFAAAAAEVRLAGVAAKVLDGQFPSNKTSIIGLTTGTAFAELKTSGCRFLPGAYCDNLTSYGAYFTIPKNLIDKKTGKRRKFQLSVADFIRHGATAASGAVYEPYAIREKFPLPTVHVHYANGCSIGESFYQSVSGPYQQLLVGDPLCQPWAKVPVVTAQGIAARQIIRGQIDIKPAVDEKTVAPIKEFELYVDGLRIKNCKPGETLTLDTTTLHDGHHELRIVARDDTPIETQGRLIVEVTVKNGREAIALTTKQKNLSIASKYVAVEVLSTTETPVEVFCNHQRLGKLATGSGTLRVSIAKLGPGPVELVAKSDSLRSTPLKLDILP